ncbi:MAG: hypothetical protein ACI4MF_02575 [Candidatus Faecivicinus sp.]
MERTKEVTITDFERNSGRFFDAHEAPALQAKQPKMKINGERYANYPLNIPILQKKCIIILMQIQSDIFADKKRQSRMNVGKTDSFFDFLQQWEQFDAHAHRILKGAMV